MKIAVGVPVRGALPYFKKMISSLRRNTKSPYALVICDDDSDVETSRYIERLNPDFLIRHKNQQWFTRSANDILIVSYLHGADFIFLLNSDITLPSGWMEKMLEYFNDYKVTLVGSLYHSAKSLPMKVFKPHYVTGHCWALRAKDLLKVGILDETMVHIESDREFTHRILNRGRTAILDKSIPIKHAGAKSWHYNIRAISTIDPAHITTPRNINLLSDPTVCARLKRKYRIK